MQPSRRVLVRGFAVACLVRALPFTGCAGALLTAQSLPPMVATVSTDDVTYTSEISGNAGFGYLRCTADPIAGGAWYRAVLCAHLSDYTAYVEDGGTLPLAATSIGLGTVAGEFPAISGANYPVPTWAVEATHGALHTAFDALLMDGSQGSPEAVFSGGACLFYATPTIVHHYHTTDNHGWRYDAGSQAFNLSYLREAAVWDRVQHLYDYPEEFFDDDYGLLTPYELEVGITLIAVQGAVDPTSATPDNPPSLHRYPTQAPKIGKSSRACVRFTGTVVEFLFVPPGSFVPIQTVVAGNEAAFPAAGYRPNMQIALSSTTTPERFELPVHWKNFGKIKFTVPATADGFYDVTHYRYQVMTPSGPTWLPWQAIPALQQAHVFVP